MRDAERYSSVAATSAEPVGYTKYHVFLSHNSQDKTFVRPLADWLQKHSITCFLDEQNLQPGDVLSNTLEKALNESAAAIICIGEHGEGPWQAEEIHTLLNRAIRLSRERNEFRIIPVLLPKADTTKLRWFLQTRLWCDLSRGITDSEPDLLRLKAAILGEQDDRSLVADRDIHPYRGLESFSITDHAFFFGRANESAKLATMVRDWRLACIVGPSGNGKSSLARAGLASEAAKRAVPGIDGWPRLFVRPGNDLLRSILDQLFAKLPGEHRGTAVAAALGRIAPDRTRITAEEWAGGLDLELKSFYSDTAGPVLILVDQLEELFTHRGIVTVTEDQQTARIQGALGGLAKLCQSGEGRWHVVLTLRSDFFQRCRISEAFWNLLSKEHLTLKLDELNETGWREAIKGPAARAGAYLEAGLVETMLRDVYRQRGSMPLLQLALQELWRLRTGACLTHAAYTSIGGVANALQTRAEKALELLSQDDPEHLEIARNLFLRLTSPGEGVIDTRRRVDRSELDWERTAAGKVEHVLSQLSAADSRLIITDEQAVGVTHEVLIRDCQTIRDWIEFARREIPILRRLTYAARRWDEDNRGPTFLNASDPPRELKQWVRKTNLRLTNLEREYWRASRDERARLLREKRVASQRLLQVQQQRAREAIRARKRITVVAGVALALAIVGVVFALVAYRSASRARIQEGIAQAKTKEVETQKGIAEAKRKEAEDQRARADMSAQEAAAKAREAQEQKEIAEEKRKEAEDQRARADKNAQEAVANARETQEQKENAEERRKEAEDQRARADKNAQEAVANAREARRQERIAEAKTEEAVAGRYQIALARVNDLRQDDPALAMQLLLSNKNCPDNLRDFTWSYLFALALESPRRKSGTLRPSPHRELVSTWTHTSPATALAFSPESNLLACGLADGSIVLRNRTTGKDDGTLRGHEGAVRALRFAPQGTTLVSGGDDATVRVWDVRQRELRATLRGHAAVVAVDVTQDGAWILSGAGSATRGSEQVASDASAASPPAVGLKLWDLGTGKELSEAVLSPGPVRAAAFCPGTRSVVLVQCDGQVFCYQPSTGQFATLPLQNVGCKRALLDGSLSPENDDLFVPESLTDRPSSDRSSIVVDTAQALTFAADGTALAILAQSGKDTVASLLAVWHFGEAGQQDDEEAVSPMETPRAVPRDLLLPPVLTPPPDPPLLPLSPEHDSLPLPPPEPDSLLPFPVPEPVATTPPVFEFPPRATDQGGEPRQFEWAREEGEVMDLFEQAISLEQSLADALLLTARSRLILHRGQVTAIAFSPDGRTLALGHSDGGIQLCDGYTGMVRLTLRGHHGPVRSLTFAPDGTALASSSTDADGAVMIHNGLDGSARILANKPDYWRQAYSTVQARWESGWGTTDEVHSAAAFLAAAEAELAWEAGNSETAMRRMADATEHAESWCGTATEAWTSGCVGSLDGLAWAIEMRDRMQLASFRVNQPAQQVVAGFVGVESSRLPVLRDVTGGLRLGRTPAGELEVLQEKVQDLESLFHMTLISFEVGATSRDDSLLAGCHLEVARASVAWAQGNLEATIDHICLAIKCCESLVEFRKFRALMGSGDRLSVSHAQTLLVNIQLTLTRLREHQQGIPFAPSLPDVIERTSLEATGKVGTEEIMILRRMITELDNLTHVAAKLVEDGRIRSGESDSLARRLERAKADLAWAQGDRDGVRGHLETALVHAERAAAFARPMLGLGIELDQVIRESVLNYYGARLDLVRLDRTTESGED